MILETVFGLSLVIHASLDSRFPFETGALAEISSSQKQAALLPLVERATECIVRAVRADSRFSNDIRPVELNELIIESMPTCGGSLHAMKDTHDRLYGTGSGEAFLIGPYLDMLPAAVSRQIRIQPASR
jgi:hypothetical protein